jgi:hypothetical protein
MTASVRNVFLVSFLCASCSVDIKMYPVQGPMAQRKPLPVLTATADGITNNTGNITISSLEGETCSGKWSSVAPQEASVTSVSLLTQYGAIAGIMSTVGPKPGVNRGEAFIVCPSGTNFQAEFYTGSGTANGYGVGKDSNGNVFKLLF